MWEGNGRERPHVLILGGGFGGLTAAQALRRVPVRVTVVDRKNHHLFQPLLYQVAMAGLSPAEIASPIRAILRRQPEAAVVLGAVRRIDLDGRAAELEGGERLGYDFLILATGAETSFFGHDEWARVAPGLKDLDDAVEIRRRVLLAFESAERERDPDEQRRLLTFVVVGGGPTGVELAGALAELRRFVLARDFRAIRPESARVILVEAGPRILSTFSERLSASAVRQLAKLGVEVRTGTPVEDIDAAGVRLHGGELVPSATVLWGAGVRTTPLPRTLGVPLDRAGRVLVEPDLSVPGHPEAFVIGDAAAFLHQTGAPLPGVSPVAMQEARAVARSIARTLAGEPRETFRYVDRGNMATIGRSKAIAQIGKLELRGFPAWLAWLLIHLVFLIGFRNRLIVLLDWTISYFTYRRGARLVTGHRIVAGPPVATTESSRPPGTGGPGPRPPTPPPAGAPLH